MAIDLNDLTFENIGIWPLPVKVTVVVILCIMIIGMGFWFDSRAALRRLGQSQQEEIDLKTTFEIKSSQAANLETYKQQVITMQQMFGDMLGRLPARSEIPGLIEDISKLGVANGLEFKLIKPEQEERKDFYAELPIRISVTGSYHQLAEFISSVSSLQRIVTLDDFTISRGSKALPGGKKQDDDTLTMDITARTYRYVNEPLPEQEEKQ